MKMEKLKSMEPNEPKATKMRGKRNAKCKSRKGRGISRKPEKEFQRNQEPKGKEELQITNGQVSSN